MQRGSTILQYLTVRPDVSFPDPATPDGKALELRIKGHHPASRKDGASVTGAPDALPRRLWTYSSVSSPSRNVLLQSRFPTHITHSPEKATPTYNIPWRATTDRSSPPSTPYSFHYKVAMHILPHLPPSHHHTPGKPILELRRRELAV